MTPEFKPFTREFDFGSFFRVIETGDSFFRFQSVGGLFCVFFFISLLKQSTVEPTLRDHPKMQRFSGCLEEVPGMVPLGEKFLMGCLLIAHELCNRAHVTQIHQLSARVLQRGSVSVPAFL